MSDIETSLRTGIMVETDDPNLRDTVTSLTEAQITWVSSWLAGEGFVRRTQPPLPVYALLVAAHALGTAFDEPGQADERLATYEAEFIEKVERALQAAGWQPPAPEEPDVVLIAVSEFDPRPPVVPPQEEEPARRCPACGQPAEVPGEGRYCGSCQDHEGHCPDDHCMTCGAST